ncbi:Predicted permease [Proteiniborus ethanoligenes]|uniref:Predicted permease n=1 Tax=Proteiniborus ethanoligenes TaxID=415015 RepID=A0A1H3QCM6_9FIRM|nr:permease [Proteiniborus ethanoligenes]TAH63313.1 MAG: permease [Gottschalkiaceae bacterium]SDZ10785.1 Predicted permease [Proteiniborus ethanoligenes]
MKKLISRYKFFLVLLAVNTVILFIYPSIGKSSLEITKKNIIEMISIIPPIFILLGLLDVWVEKETMMKFMGPNSGITGILISFLLGSVAAGPLYAAFPVAGTLLKKGSKLSNVLIFIGSWSTTKIPLLLFEASSMGLNFMLLRFALNLPVIAAIAIITEKTLSSKEKEDMYNRAALLE